MTEIRRPDEADREAMVEALRFAFNPPAAWQQRMRDLWRLERFLCAYDEGRLVATAQAYPLTQWFGGRPIPMAGIATVATIPEVRGTGVASEMMRQLITARRAAGDAISTLYPAVLGVYRRLGYEYGGIFSEYEIAPGALPAGEGRVEEFRVQDLPALKDSFRRFARAHNGPADSDDDDWWEFRVLRRRVFEEPSRAVVVPGQDGIDGYAAFSLEEVLGEWGFMIECTHLVAETREAAGALLAYFRRFAGVGQALRWHGPPNEPLLLLIGDARIQPRRVFRFMTRILDVPRAFESRGYPEVDGEAVLAVEDPLFPENAGPWRITAEAGSVRVEPADAPATKPIPVGALATMFTGNLSPYDLARLGALDPDDPSLPFLARLFAGPAPWMPDFF